MMKDEKTRAAFTIIPKDDVYTVEKLSKVRYMKRIKYGFKIEIKTPGTYLIILRVNTTEYKYETLEVTFEDSNL